MLLVPTVAIAFAALLLRCNAQDCFEFPAGVDFAPVLQATAELTTANGSLQSPATLAPFFDQFTSEALLDFKDIKSIKFTLPYALPQLALLRARGNGSFLVELHTDGNKGATEKYLGLTAKNHFTMEINTTAWSTDRITWLTVKQAEFAEPGSLTKLQFLGASFTYNQYGPEPSPPKKPCNCTGEGLGKGQTCGKWDDDCPSTGWCYVEVDADCSDITPSRTPGYYWSCIPCGGFYNLSEKLTPAPEEFQAAPSPPDLGGQPTAAPRPPVARTVIAGSCACGGRFALGMTIGIVIGAFLSYFCQRLLCRKAYHGLPVTEEEMGTKGSHSA